MNSVNLIQQLLRSLNNITPRIGKVVWKLLFSVAGFVCIQCSHCYSCHICLEEKFKHNQLCNWKGVSSFLSDCCYEEICLAWYHICTNITYIKPTLHTRNNTHKNRMIHQHTPHIQWGTGWSKNWWLKTVITKRIVSSGNLQE